MGEIVQAKHPVWRHRVLLIGQAPGADGDTRPLTGTMGLDLAVLAGLHDRSLDARAARCGLDRDERIGLWFDRANVLDFYPGRGNGKGHAFPLGHAAAAASLMVPLMEEYDRVLYCGKAVYDAFRRARGREIERNLDKLVWYMDLHTSGSGAGQLFAWMPHTSKVNPWWNDAANVHAASAFLRETVGWVRGGAILRASV